MIHRLIPRTLAVLAAALLAACSGGGGSGGPVPTPGPTVNPGIETISPLGFASSGGGHGGGQCPHGSPGTGCTSVYALSSDPAGVVVQRVDPSGQTTSFNTTLTTPASDTLPDSSTNLQYQFAAGLLGTPFTVNVQQIHDGPHQVYYNRNADSSGAVDATQLQALRRGVLASGSSVRSLAGEVHRRPQRSAAAQILGDRVYVRFRASALRQSGRTVADALGALRVSGRELPTTNPDPLTVVGVPAGTTAAAFTQTLRARSDVAAVYPVHKRYALSRPATSANDPHFKLPDQWYLVADGFPYAWSYTSGASATVAVIDTGVDLTNTDLSSQVTFSEGVLNGKTTASQVDKDGHGTNVAGIAAAAANNSLGFAGGGYNAKLIAISIFDPATGFASPSDEAIAIGDAVAHGADVINLSLGAEASFDGNTNPNSNEGYDQGEYEAIQAAIQAGVTVVAAAGNNRDGLDPNGDGYAHANLDYPAAYPGVISVGASQINDNNTGNYATASESVTAYSQSGNGLSLVAPGGQAGPDQPNGDPDPDLLHWIWGYYSTTANQPCSYGRGTLPQTPTNCTALFNGTSQATPQVSAAAALLYAAAGGHRTLTPAQVAQLLQSTADNINDPNQGHGRLNVYRAVAALVKDSGATYSGPQPRAHSAGQTIAFAYANSGSNRPTILDYDYPVGVPVDPTTGAFRIADVRPADAPSGYKVGVWYDANGNGAIDAGDSVGTSASSCTTTTRCAIGTIRLTTVGGTYALP
ncbi:MAG: serine protease [Candidatus Eremiobacteraeota bacterium]|nr:serine protease [Candidatus Eremiobacteraeota bacterium]